MYIIYTEIFPEDYTKPVERWYYGTYSDRDQANEIAIALNEGAGPRIYRCVCDASEARKLGIRNLPA